MLDHTPTEAQIKLIDSLQSMFDEVRKESKEPNDVHFISARGTIADNMKMVNKYICSCGGTTNSVNHTTIAESDESAIDTYHLNCKLCGNLEKISFVMLRKALSDNNTLEYQPRSMEYPYI